MRSDDANRARAPLLLRVMTWAGLAFLNVPVFIIALYAFSTDEATTQFPPSGLTTKWFAVAFARDDIWAALWLSVKVASIATLVAMLVGSLAAFALVRGRFFGKDAITLMLILPIALPGIVTGIALLSSIKLAGLTPGLVTLILGHATFCVVTVYNNVVARLRRMPQSLVEASADLGANGFQTLRHVLLPQLATALLAGGLLAFALSFDEIIVTIFTAGAEQTLPIWFYAEMFRPRDPAITNVVAVMVITITLVPILLAYKLTQGTEDVAGSSK